RWGIEERGVRVLQAPPVAVYLRSPGKRSAPGNEDVARTSIRDWRPFPRMRPSALSGLRAGAGVIQPVVRRESESPDNGTVTNPESRITNHASRLVAATTHSRRSLSRNGLDRRTSAGSSSTLV